MQGKLKGRVKENGKGIGSPKADKQSKAAADERE
jgi:hypothetical protein